MASAAAALWNLQARIVMWNQAVNGIGRLLERPVTVQELDVALLGGGDSEACPAVTTGLHLYPGMQPTH